jgi:hypothetical protein
LILLLVLCFVKQLQAIWLARFLGWRSDGNDFS